MIVLGSDGIKVTLYSLKPHTFNTGKSRKVNYEEIGFTDKIIAVSFSNDERYVAFASR